MKKVISIALALLMVAVMLPVMAMADDSIYTITLSDNTTQSITVKNGATCTLNLNGKTLTNEAGKDTITVEFGGTLIVEGDGKVDNISDGCAAIFNNGTVTLNGGTFDRSAETSTGKTKAERGNNSWYTICNHGTLIINSGVTITTANKATDKGRYSSLIENGYQNYAGNTSRAAYVSGTNQEYPSLLINGGEFFGGINTIKNDDNGMATIKGGSSTNYYQASVQNHHKMVIENGSFSGETAWSVMNCGADCVYNANHDAHELIITNGNFKGDVRANVGSVQIKGGSFESSFTQEGNANIEISGGTFNTNVKDFAGRNVVVGYGNNYYVGDDAAEIVEKAQSGTITVESAGNNNSFTVKPGVTVQNNWNDDIKVNGESVYPGKSYTVPGAPIIIYTPDNEPAILSGANQVVAPGSAATFRIDEEYDRLLAVAVDGVTLDKSNYEAWSGSTYIKLLPKFMKTLSVGTHTLTAYFTSHTVSTTFTISGGAKNPATGANDFVGVAAARAVISLLGAAAVIRKK